MKIIKIKITQEIIDFCKSERMGWYNPCPITYVLRQNPEFYRLYVIVNALSIRTDKKYRVPQKVKTFLVNWSKYREVKPISFFLIEQNSIIDKINKFWFDLYFK